MTYLKFFGLASEPFESAGVRPLVLGTGPLRRSVAWVRAELAGGKSFLCVRGAPGVGKSMLAVALPRVLEQQVALISDPTVSWQEIEAVVTEALDLTELSREALQWMPGSSSEPPVIVVDRAESLPAETFDRLEALRTPFDAEVGPILSLVFVVDERRIPTQLGRAEATCTLAVLQPRELRRYIEARMMNAGFEGDEVFPLETCQAVHAATLGVPSGVDLLCTTLLVEAARREASMVDSDLVAMSCGDADAPALKHRASVEPPPPPQPQAASSSQTPDIDLPQAIGAAAAPAESSELPAEWHDVRAKYEDASSHTFEDWQTAETAETAETEETGETGDAVEDRDGAISGECDAAPATAEDVGLPAERYGPTVSWQDSDPDTSDSRVEVSGDDSLEGELEVGPHEGHSEPRLLDVATAEEETQAATLPSQEFEPSSHAWPAPALVAAAAVAVTLLVAVVVAIGSLGESDDTSASVAPAVLPEPTFSVPPTPLVAPHSALAGESLEGRSAVGPLAEAEATGRSAPAPSLVVAGSDESPDFGETTEPSELDTAPSEVVTADVIPAEVVTAEVITASQPKEPSVVADRSIAAADSGEHAAPHKVTAAVPPAAPAGIERSAPSVEPSKRRSFKAARSPARTVVKPSSPKIAWPTGFLDAQSRDAQESEGPTQLEIHEPALVGLSRASR